MSSGMRNILWMGRLPIRISIGQPFGQCKKIFPSPPAFFLLHKGRHRFFAGNANVCVPDGTFRPSGVCRTVSPYFFPPGAALMHLPGTFPGKSRRRPYTTASCTFLDHRFSWCCSSAEASSFNSDSLQSNALGSCVSVTSTFLSSLFTWVAVALKVDMSWVYC